MTGSMDFLDINSLKLLAISLWLSIFAAVIPETIVAVFAVLASGSTIIFNIYRYYETRKPKKNDGTTEESK